MSVISLIRFYQRIISPDQGMLGRIFSTRPVCTMYPSCSEYTIIAVQKYGSLKGVSRGLRRILRCHPWQKELIDLP